VSFLSKGDGVGDDGRYIIDEKIGQGGMQEVFRALDDKLRRSVALKVPLNQKAARRFKDSAVISAKVNHPNVAKTLDYFEDETDRFYLVEELVEGLNLRQIAKHFERLDPHAVAHVLHHLARGLAASHDAGVVHRDLKPSNILIAGGLAFEAVKITDFGIAKMAEGEIGDVVSGGEESTLSSMTVRGALPYMAPEVIDDPHTPSPPADVWAIAAISWELLSGFPPFGTGLKAVSAILNEPSPALPTEPASHPQFGPLTEAIGKILSGCFDKKPADRPTAEELAGLCDGLCYLPVVRDVGRVNAYIAPSLGFILSDEGEEVFFHTQNVVGTKPGLGTKVWYSQFEGKPHPRAIPVVPMVFDPDAEA
jgi:serine/threonine-protein kinase